jgi:GDP-D-mannose dehydratase
MWLMLQRDEADDYVIGTGATHSIRDLLDAAFAVVGIMTGRGMSSRMNSLSSRRKSTY